MDETRQDGSAVPPPPSCLLPELSAEEVYKNILRCHALGSRVKLRLLARESTVDSSQSTARSGPLWTVDGRLSTSLGASSSG